jgi:hypothetical protein
VVGRGLWEAGTRPITRMAPRSGMEDCMGDLREVASAPRAGQDLRALAQRALACELRGDWERAVLLIRHLQRPSADPGDPPAPFRMPGPA